MMAPMAGTGNLDPAMEKNVASALDRIRTTSGFDRVRFIILYGSARAGTTKAGSDIDLSYLI